MCTIIVTAGKSGKKQAQAEWFDMMRDITLEAESQGRGATGVIVEKEDGGVFWKKRPVPCREAMKFEGLDEMPDLMAIHARSGFNYPDDREYDKNHHPFPGLNILLMHEGMSDCGFAGWSELADTLGIELDTTTDSELLMQIVDREDDLQTGLRRAFDLLPYWQIGTAIYDWRTPGKIYFASTDRRCSNYPIIRCTKFNSVMLISSECMVSKKWQQDIEIIEYAEPFKLYTFDVHGTYTVESI